MGRGSQQERAWPGPDDASPHRAGGLALCPPPQSTRVSVSLPVSWAWSTLTPWCPEGPAGGGGLQVWLRFPGDQSPTSCLGPGKGPSETPGAASLRGLAACFASTIKRSGRRRVAYSGGLVLEGELAGGHEMGWGFRPSSGRCCIPGPLIP